jgi:hypothetical protein
MLYSMLCKKLWSAFSPRPISDWIGRAIKSWPIPFRLFHPFSCCKQYLFREQQLATENFEQQACRSG